MATVNSQVAIIGGGLAGLACAIRLAEQEIDVTLYEAAPRLGGRTRSFVESRMGMEIDNGPHLLIGAYHATRNMLSQCGAEHNIAWQPSLSLPLWESGRGHFTLAPSRRLPLPLAILTAIVRLPGHSPASALDLLRIAMHSPAEGSMQTVSQWLQSNRIGEAISRDLLIPLCLGAMNEPPENANAASFAQVLKQSFASHATARLGWFTGPLSTALIHPMERRAKELGVHIRTATRIDQLGPDEHGVRIRLRNGEATRFGHAVLAIPAHARDRLLGRRFTGETRPISNIHLWFDEDISLPAPFVGGIGTYGQWFFDLRQQMREALPSSYLCAVISADRSARSDPIPTLCDEIAAIAGLRQVRPPVHWRVVRELHATVLVRSSDPTPPFHEHITEACEEPRPGELPATIESAIQRGEKAARDYLLAQG